MDLVVLGLLISIPIVVFGSSLVLRLVERWPVIIQLGAAVLAFTAAKMVLGEPLLAEYLKSVPLPSVWLHGIVIVVAIAGVLLAGRWRARRNSLTDSTTPGVQT
jgi:predicted tellurium resistance membrane protein TerC